MTQVSLSESNFPFPGEGGVKVETTSPVVVECILTEEPPTEKK